MQEDIKAGRRIIQKSWLAYDACGASVCIWWLVLSFTTIEGSLLNLSDPGALVSVILWLAHVAAEDVITLTSATLDKRL